MTAPGNVDGLVVARAIAGDREVLDDILAALQGPLYRYISRLLTHRETAEDALQEMLFRICKKIVWLRDPELLRPWAFRIASRECFRQLRREKRRGGVGQLSKAVRNRFLRSPNQTHQSPEDGESGLGGWTARSQHPRQTFVPSPGYHARLFRPAQPESQAL